MNEPHERASRDALADVATRAVRAGGDYLAGEFRNGRVDGEYGSDDVKAVADHEAESRVLAVIREAYPEHALHGEESGRVGESRYEWVVDPLDGTNNFASGLPSFATAVAVLRDGDPVVSAIYEPLPDTLYVARDGAGATVDGRPLATGSDVALGNGTVSFVVGLPAVRDEALAARADTIETALDGRCKRVLNTWSPCVDWGLVARGSLEGIVCFHPDVYEQHAGELLAREAGVVSASREGLYVGAGDAETRDELLAVVDGV
ncbi:myo-inositol-1(or 4)-monophosphatase [Halogranum amylolyticum]|uniref:fructose-bisphosphatase n=1 Tax=Halogranum amylolyticum TaxID=660520 RepID=A0A1H8U1Y4_9EURY|nr:inositol monophosphatase [Halogranum amylolyticum]SEO96658.1 myo-inositol-1(or 4)-monophosphatase [Halogranum amylolyticum]